MTCLILWRICWHGCNLRVIQSNLGARNTGQQSELQSCIVSKTVAHHSIRFPLSARLILRLRSCSLVCFTKYCAQRRSHVQVRVGLARRDLSLLHEQYLLLSKTQHPFLYSLSPQTTRNLCTLREGARLVLQGNAKAALKARRRGCCRFLPRIRLLSVTLRLYNALSSRKWAQGCVQQGREICTLTQKELWASSSGEALTWGYIQGRADVLHLIEGCVLHAAVCFIEHTSVNTKGNSCGNVYAQYETKVYVQSNSAVFAPTVRCRTRTLTWNVGRIPQFVCCLESCFYFQFRSSTRIHAVTCCWTKNARQRGTVNTVLALNVGFACQNCWVC